MKFKVLYWLPLTIALSGCLFNASPKATTEWAVNEPFKDKFFVDGRLGVQKEEKGYYANFDWEVDHAVQSIKINTPLGNSLGELCQDKLGVVALDNNGVIYHANTPEELSQNLLGFMLPLQYLVIWFNGQRIPNLDYKISQNGKLKQFDWQISRKIDQDGNTKILLLEKPDLSIKLAFSDINYEVDSIEKNRVCGIRNAL